MLVEIAPAKINLSLHVVGRRADGWHDLDSLVAFAGIGDRLTLEPGSTLSFAVSGPTATAAGPDADNLVLKAVAAAQARVPGLTTGHFTLLKRLPVAAGIGGGSSDAAAALRLLARANALPLDDPRLMEAARATGADVAVCLDPRPKIMRGVGDQLSAPLALPQLGCVLVNPGVPVATPPVFRALALTPGTLTGLPEAPDFTAATTAADLLARLATARNDLTAPALQVAPVIAEVLERLKATPRARLVRMSGSGATCFALYDSCRAAAIAAKLIRQKAPDWWVRSTVVGGHP